MRIHIKIALLSLAISLLFSVSCITALADTTYQEQTGYDKTEGSSPESFNGALDGLQNMFDSTAQRNDGMKPGEVNGEAGSEEHGAGSSSGSGKDNSNSSSGSSEETGYVEIMGTEKGEDTYKEVQVIEPGSTITTEIKKPGSSSTEKGNDSSTDKGTTAGSSNGNDGSSSSENNSDSNEIFPIYEADIPIFKLNSREDSPLLILRSVIRFLNSSSYIQVLPFS